ncbi:50S ribosomal protein L29 [Candidatus Woesearchaeota archaeon]|mgnify:FL=1|jgi:large subunit ribosomal protein L29|nr:50S ribosomal protein L29 [Candidatus Woesearchaeota archaeon]MBT4368714.1 50S ribosomal protein L29 [Candidatus Woesearchaeota archaeon]MBT4712003.1 50S ribosomal protein L29 [Candidatus Woesearchaeota archaeon]MBT6638898.1 50S ribosomal protein L29 [Candidatus Woesearchaeota archaeon]MBT7134542.1 50S ribosomal protein L29 [Candidatus Woesearchaeota archaeon]
MKSKELRDLNNADLQNKLKELKKELMQDYSQISTGTPPKSPGMLKQRKKTIAKILTITNSRKLEKEAEDKQ